MSYQDKGIVEVPNPRDFERQLSIDIDVGEIVDIAARAMGLPSGLLQLSKRTAEAITTAAAGEKPYGDFVNATVSFGSVETVLEIPKARHGGQTVVNESGMISVPVGADWTLPATEGDDPATLMTRPTAVGVQFRTRQERLSPTEATRRAKALTFVVHESRSVLSHPEAPNWKVKYWGSPYALEMKVGDVAPAVAAEVTAKVDEIASALDSKQQQNSPNLSPER